MEKEMKGGRSMHRMRLVQLACVCSLAATWAWGAGQEKAEMATYSSLLAC